MGLDMNQDIPPPSCDRGREIGGPPNESGDGGEFRGRAGDPWRTHLALALPRAIADAKSVGLRMNQETAASFAEERETPGGRTWL